MDSSIKKEQPKPSPTLARQQNSSKFETLSEDAQILNQEGELLP